MKVVHTSDWHVGKLLRGASRIDEHRAVLGEIAEIADRGTRRPRARRRRPLRDRRAAARGDGGRATTRCWRLRETGAHVVVVGGNHDQQPQLDAVAPVFARLGITVLGLPAGPERAVVDVAGARVVMLPWMSQRWAIKTEQLMGATAAATAQFYAARVARLLAWLSEGFSADTINIVAAHCMVQGGTLGGGERDAQLIDEYTVPTAAPSRRRRNYVALGHLHRAQQMPGAGADLVLGLADPGRLRRRSRRRKQVLVVDIPDRGAAKVDTGRAARGAAAAHRHAAPSPSSKRSRPSAGDAFLRVVRARAAPARSGRRRPGAPAERGRRAGRARALAAGATPTVSRSAPGATTPRDLFAAVSRRDRPRAIRRLGSFDELLDPTTRCSGRRDGRRKMRPIARRARRGSPPSGSGRPSTSATPTCSRSSARPATASRRSSTRSASRSTARSRVTATSDIAPGDDARLQRNAGAFTFELAAIAYLATRVVRRKPTGDGAKHARAAARARSTTTAPPRCSRARRASSSPRSSALVGLDFEQFTKCVVLPQGQFASFLQAQQPATASRSSARCSTSAATTAWPRPPAIGPAARRACARRSSRSGAAAPRSTRKRSTRTAGAATRSAAWWSTSTPARAVDERLARRRSRRPARRRHGPVDHRGARPGPRRPEDRAARARDHRGDGGARRRRRRRGRGRGAGDDRRERARRAARRSTTLTSALEAHVERATIADRIAKGTEIQAGLVIRASEAATRSSPRNRPSTDAQTAVDETNRQHAHAELRGEPRQGEPCPVCEQTVDAAPAQAQHRGGNPGAQGAGDRSPSKQHGRDEGQRDSHGAAQGRGAARITARASGRARRQDRGPPRPSCARGHDRRRDGTRARRPQTARGRAAPGARRPSPPRTVASRPRSRSSMPGEHAFQRQRDAVVAAGLTPPRRRRAEPARAVGGAGAFATDHRPEPRSGRPSSRNGTRPTPPSAMRCSASCDRARPTPTSTRAPRLCPISPPP